MPLRWGRALFWAPAVGLLVLAVVYVADKWVFYWLLREDHVVEWTQFALVLASCPVALLAAARLMRQGRWWAAALLVLVGAAAFVLAGEEISWAQRVLGWETPADLAAGNRQGELNVHNLQVGDVQADALADVVELAMALGGLLLSVLSRPMGTLLNRTALWSLAPPLAAVPGFVLMVLYQVMTITIGPSAAPAILIQEWVEIGLYGGVAVTVASVFARAARGRVVVQRTARRGVRRLSPRAPAGLAPVAVAVLVVVGLAVVCAVLTTWTGMVPGNVPDSMT